MQTPLRVTCFLLLLAIGSASQAQDGSAFELARPAGEMAVQGIPPENGHLGIYADPLGTQTCATIPAGSIGTLYLFADLAGETALGFTGAEFRVQVTNPAGYLFLFTPPPASNIQIGSAFDTTPDDPRDYGGINVAFPACQNGPRVPMGTIMVLNMGTGGPTELWVVRRNLPTNPNFPCPWFVRCDIPSYTGVCMGPCAVDPYGIEVTSRAAINDAGCAETAVCPAACPGAPCVDLTAAGPGAACIGEPITITATATNCSPEPEDIDLFIDYTLVQSFLGVPSGASVQASSTIPMPDCAPSNNKHIPVGAVARNTICAEPFGLERMKAVLCDERLCGGNLPPDCSAARPSVDELWPPNGKLVPVSIVGIVDPNGDPLEILINRITSDEPTGEYGRRDCPDAGREGPNLVQLRAERDGNGDGRVYTLDYVASEPSGLRCRGQVQVCVPKQRHRGCVDGGRLYEAYLCGEWGPAGDEFASTLRIEPLQDGGVALSFATPVSGEVRLDVYDIRGRHVRTLAAAPYAAGPHRLRWDGRDDGGAPAAAGIYFFRLQVGAATQTGKGVLMR